MEGLSFNRINSRWKRRPLPRSSFRSLPPIPLLLLIFCLLFYVSYKHISSSLLRISKDSPAAQFPHRCKILTCEKFVWYAPHSGFSNQSSEFKKAVFVAAILNRTLVAPPILDHHAVAIGTCPKFRVLDSKELRLSVWNHVFELIHSRRYVSMADIIDLSKLVSASDVRVIDFRVFVSIWCGANIDLICPQESEKQLSMDDSLRQFGSLLSGYSGGLNDCLYALYEDCRTTVWTYGKDGEDGTFRISCSNFSQFLWVLRG